MSFRKNELRQEWRTLRNCLYRPQSVILTILFAIRKWFRSLHFYSIQWRRTNRWMKIECAFSTDTSAHGYCCCFAVVVVVLLLLLLFCCCCCFAVVVVLLLLLLCFQDKWNGTLPRKCVLHKNFIYWQRGDFFPHLGSRFPFVSSYFWLIEPQRFDATIWCSPIIKTNLNYFCRVMWRGGRKGVARTTFADECTFGGNKTQIIQKPLFLDWQVELKIQVNSLSMITFKWHLNFQNMSNVFTLIK